MTWRSGWTSFTGSVEAEESAILLRVTIDTAWSALDDTARERPADPTAGCRHSIASAALDHDGRIVCLECARDRNAARDPFESRAS